MKNHSADENPYQSPTTPPAAVVTAELVEKSTDPPSLFEALLTFLVGLAVISAALGLVLAVGMLIRWCLA